MRSVFFHGLVAGALSSLAAIIYCNAYTNALAVNFSQIINPVSMAGSSIVGCLLASLGFFVFSRKVKKKPDVWFNVIFTVLTFASCAGPFATRLPLNISAPELFIGLVMPMHFFPQLFWMSTKPLFSYGRTK